MTDPWESGVLDKEKHDRLVAKLDEYCAAADIPKHYVWQSAKPFLVKKEDQWLDHTWDNSERGIHGLLYVGPFADPDVSQRMCMLAAVFMRNYQKVRRLSLQGLLQRLKDGEAPDALVVFVPDFLIKGANFPTERERSLIYSWLLDRAARQTQTVLAVARFADVEEVWSPAIKEHIKKFVVIQGETG